MSAAQNLTIDASSDPVLVIVPAMLGRVVQPTRRYQADGCRLLGTTGPSADAGAVSITFGDVDMLDPADATWEDAEWQ